MNLTPDPTFRIGDHRYTAQQVLLVNQVFHNEEAAYYNDLFAPQLAQERDHWRALLRQAAPWLPLDATKRRWVDFGCGTGLVASVMTEFAGPLDTIYCLDLSTAMLRQAQATLASLTERPVAYLRAAGAPFQPASIDLIGLNSVLHHLPSPSDTLTELACALKPGGLLALAHEPNRAAYTHPLIRALVTLRLVARRLRRGFSAATAAVPPPYLAQSVERINAGGLLPWSVSAQEVVEIANIQVPHPSKPDRRRLGFDLKQISTWLPGFSRLYGDSMGMLGTYASPNRAVQTLENWLYRRYPHGGRLISGLWRKDPD